MKKVTLNQVIKEIVAAESAYGKVVAMIPSIKASGIKKDELRTALQEAWGFADMKPKSREYNNTKQKVSKWISTIFEVKMSKAKKEELRLTMTKGRKAKIIAVLEEFNIDSKTAAKIAAKLVS